MTCGEDSECEPAKSNPCKGKCVCLAGLWDLGIVCNLAIDPATFFSGGFYCNR